MTNEELKITCRELMDALDDVKKSVLKAKTAMHNIEGLLQKESLDSSDDRDDGYKTGIETAWKYARKIELLNMGETKNVSALMMIMKRYFQSINLIFKKRLIWLTLMRKVKLIMK